MNQLLPLLPEVVLAVAGLAVFTALLAGEGRMRYARDAGFAEVSHPTLRRFVMRTDF